MINKVKDFLGVRRKFTLVIYGIGYMSNVFHVKDVEIFSSKRYLDNHEANALAVSYLNRSTINYPLISSEIIG